LLDEDFLSHREKAKKNRLLRNLPVLPQHTEQKYEETESYIENGLRYLLVFTGTCPLYLPGLHLGPLREPPGYHRSRLLVPDLITISR
jgi:hypothetical protein